MRKRQPKCGLMEPHNFHNVSEIDMHFKERRYWCDGICEWCFRVGVPKEALKPGYLGFYGYGLHGNGSHK